jgi:dihydrofolate reductase
MKLTITTFTTLDGVMQGPGGQDEDATNDFRLGGWLVPFADEDMGRFISETFSLADAILLGRTTYDMMFRFWSQVTDPNNRVATALNTLPKHVATSRPDTLTWQNSHSVVGDVCRAVRALKKRPGRELQVHGSHRLVQTLLGAELVDEFRVWIYPVVVGAGKRLFGTGAEPTSMRLLSSKVTSKGVIVASYKPSGAPTQQDVAVVDGKSSVRR